MFYGFFFTKLFPGEAERTDNKQMRKCFLDPLSYFSFASSAFSYQTQFPNSAIVVIVFVTFRLSQLDHSHCREHIDLRKSRIIPHKLVKSLSYMQAFFLIKRQLINFQGTDIWTNRICQGNITLDSFLKNFCLCSIFLPETKMEFLGKNHQLLKKRTVM